MFGLFLKTLSAAAISIAGLIVTSPAAFIKKSSVAF
jgi:hypothetical protein